MEFKRVQCANSGKILKWIVNGKEGFRSDFEFMEGRQILSGKKYNSSTTTRNKENNFVHIHHYN